jgi:hypothetical protein
VATSLNESINKLVEAIVQRAMDIGETLNVPDIAKSLADLIESCHDESSPDHREPKLLRRAAIKNSGHSTSARLIHGKFGVPNDLGDM